MKDLRLIPVAPVLAGDDVVTEGTRASWAVFSKDRIYRYMLGRVWDPTAALFVLGMLNPSTAGMDRNDPTVRRGIGFAKREKYGGLIVVNAFGGIATNPKDLLKMADPVGPRNKEAIRVGCNFQLMVRVVIAAGNPANKRIARQLKAALVLASKDRTLWRLGPPTKAGWPRHPLYLRADTPIERIDR